MGTPLRVLCLDGGGIRGVIPATVLAAMESELGQPIASSFDLIAGTSTGGILALALTIPGPNGRPRYSPADIIKMYVDEGPTIFHASVWDKLVETKKVDTAKVRVFATTPPYYDYNWTVRGDLDPALVKKLTDAFLKLDPANPAHKEIMELQRASRFIPTKAENYKSIEEAARSAGLLK